MDTVFLIAILFCLHFGGGEGHIKEDISLACVLKPGPNCSTLQFFWFLPSSSFLIIMLVYGGRATRSSAACNGMKLPDVNKAPQILNNPVSLA